TGATTMVLPADVVERLGRQPTEHRKVRYADGRVAGVPGVSDRRVVSLGRGAVISALVEAPGTTALIGQIPLEELDLLVDPKSRELRVNPASPETPVLGKLSEASQARWRA